MYKSYRICWLLLTCCLFPLFLLAHDVTDADQQVLMNGGLWSYIYVGAKHMLTGYDHLLFLVGVIFYLNNFKDILRFITAFTIGHSITLISATYLGITANEYLIDAVIALSVIYKGFENLDGFKRIFQTNSPNLLMMVFIFGLIHGFGLSTRLQSFELGNEQFLAKIISFNVGVELGQVLALIPIIFIISKWRSFKSYHVFHKIVNYFLVGAGTLLFLYQIYGYLQPPHTHEHHLHEHHEHHHDHPH
ncbi:MAG: HupE/UreJ family protein [Saprospiraceae bacterium]|nr:HupE/UreJ family protein [Saprospiraceae bacterium]